MVVDWFTWFLGLAQGIIISIVGGYILLRFILPRMAAESARHTLKELKKDGEIKPIIDKAKDIVNRLQPLVEQFKNLDLDKIQKDIKPFLDVIKKIDPKDVEDLLKSLKELTGTVQKAIEKPEKIPEPD